MKEVRKNLVSREVWMETLSFHSTHYLAPSQSSIMGQSLSDTFVGGSVTHTLSLHSNSDQCLSTARFSPQDWLLSIEMNNEIRS